MPKVRLHSCFSASGQGNRGRFKTHQADVDMGLRAQDLRPKYKGWRGRYGTRKRAILWCPVKRDFAGWLRMLWHDASYWVWKVLRTTVPPGARTGEKDHLDTS
ncbi:uncharacterized protein UV8b_01148 [Ustilaginoidea virens]|uniref:Uncharacterized protein n=1 Tax=Ustilaginoidea virens TaxID=1159556 RepID=A0A8E5MER2_USTVR|nr:uncharacterized protein UV8b_01148 [Ustilaginoidea virens]QUC16907.1 hypothetical protein UV8b_01148 [Ustilaginoidea virens]